MSTSEPGRGKQPRSQRGSVEDRWHKRGKDEYGNTIEVPSAMAGKVTRWRARYVDNAGKEHTRHFDRKVDAQKWLKDAMASVVRGDHVAPKVARLTVGEWSDKWLDGYRTRRKSTVRQAEVHLKLIKEHFGAVPLASVKPSDVRGWTAQLKAEGRADSYAYALHARLSQLFSDAVHDGIVPRNPCSRRTSPGTGKQRPYVATTEQVWALYNAVPAGIRPAILLGAHAGLRLAEAAVLRPEDVDFIRGVVSPAIHWPSEPLKSHTSKTPIPIPNELSLELSATFARGRGLTIVTAEDGRPIAGPWAIERAVRDARSKVEGLPTEFRFHDLRHYFASLLIASGLDVKVVQARLRHASAKTTLDTYGHLWPDKDESSRAAVAAVYAARPHAEGGRGRVDRLEDVLRAGESSDDLVLLLRGGEDTSAKLLRQAALFEARYTYGGQGPRGMSLFAASSAVDELAVLESKLRTYLPRSTAGCPGPRLPKLQRSCPRSKRLIGPSCSGRPAEPVSRRKSCSTI